MTEKTFTDQAVRLRADGDVEGLLRLASEQLRVDPRRSLELARSVREEFLSGDDGPRSLDVDARIIETAGLRLLGDLDAAWTLAEKTLETLDESGDPDSRAGPLYELALIARDRGDLETAERLLREILEHEVEDKKLALVRNDLAGVHFRRGDREGALRHASRARAVAQLIDDPELLAGIEANLGILADMAGDLEGALEAHLRLAVVQRECGYTSELAGTLNNLASHYMQLDRLDDALPFAEESVRLRRGAGDRLGVGLSLRTLGNIQLVLGLLEEGVKTLDEARRIWEEIGDQGQLAGTLADLAAARFEAGDKDGALKDADRAILAADASESLDARLNSHRRKGGILLDHGKVEEGTRTLEACLGLAEEIGDPKLLSIVHHSLWQAYERASDSENAHRHAIRHVELEKERLASASSARLDRLRVEHELADERLKSEAALRESERKYSEVFRASPEILAITRLEDGRLVDVNDGFCRITGLSREEVIGKTSDQIGVWVDPSDRPELFETLRRGETFQRECEFRRRSGEAGFVEISSKAVEIDGKACALTSARDVTDRKRAEEELKDAYAEVQRLRDRLEAENVYLREQIREDQDFGEIVGESTPMMEMLATIRRVAGTDATVLITGETGTGKELMARALHEQSARQDRALVKVNCSAVSAGLVESELFGHVRGAFTGAHQDREGRFELADNGTLFLDEVGELTPETQVKLLRVLEEQEFERVGSSEPLQVDVRVIAATNRDLEQAVAEGTFRADLYYRLNVFPIHAPALRDRPSDIPVLARHFLERASRRLGRGFEGFGPGTQDWMSRYSWPGNVRELRNLVERAAILSVGSLVEFAGFGTEVIVSSTPSPPARGLETVEREHIRATLEAAGWVIEGPKGAAALLGLAASTLRSRMKKLRISRDG